MNTQNEFKTFYENHLKPKLVKFEKQRKDIVIEFAPALFGYSVLMMICAILIVMEVQEFAQWAFLIMNPIFLLWIIFYAQLHQKFLVIVLGMGYVMLYAYIFMSKIESEGSLTPVILILLLNIGLIVFEFTWFQPKRKSFQLRFKTEIIRSIVRFIDKGLNYEPNKKVPVQAFHNSLLFKDKYGKQVDQWIGYDYVEGTLDNIPTVFSEVNAHEMEPDGSGGTQAKSFFKGLFFMFQFHLNFEGTILILPAKANVDNFFINFWSFGLEKIGEQLILKEPELARHFTVYTNNSKMAFYILSTGLMYNLLTFKLLIKKPVYLSVVNEKLYLAIPVKKNLFEVRLAKSVLNFELIKEFFEYMRLSKTIVQKFSVYLNKPKFPVRKENLSKTADDSSLLETSEVVSDLSEKHTLQALSGTHLASHEQFKAFYQTYLKPKLLIFEKQRKAIVKKRIVYFSIITLVFYLPVILSLVSSIFFPPHIAELFLVFFVLWFILFIPIVLLAAPYLRLKKKQWFETDPLLYQFHFKKEIIGSIVTFIDENLGYDPEKQISRNEFQTSGLWKQFPKKSIVGEDYVEGILGQTEFQFSELHTTQSNRLNKKNAKGLFFIFNFHLDFDGIVVILPKPKFNKKFRKKLMWGKDTQLNLFTLTEHPEFEQEFIVYSNNATMLNYIVHTDFREHLLAFRRQLNKPMSLSFIDGKLYMAIATKKDLFEPPIYSTLLNFKLMNEFFEYLYLGKQIEEKLSIYLKTP